MSGSSAADWVIDEQTAEESAWLLELVGCKKDRGDLSAKDCLKRTPNEKIALSIEKMVRGFSAWESITAGFRDRSLLIESENIKLFQRDRVHRLCLSQRFQIYVIYVKSKATSGIVFSSESD